MPKLENGGEFFKSEVVNDINCFKGESDVILANCLDCDILGEVVDNAYASNLFRDIGSFFIMTLRGVLSNWMRYHQ